MNGFSEVKDLIDTMLEKRSRQSSEKILNIEVCQN